MVSGVLVRGCIAHGSVGVPRRVKHRDEECVGRSCSHHRSQAKEQKRRKARGHNISLEGDLQALPAPFSNTIWGPSLWKTLKTVTIADSCQMFLILGN